MLGVEEDLAELIGILTGDGNIYFKPEKRKYYLEITGDPKKEIEYFKHINQLLLKLAKKEGRIYQRESGLKLRLYNKGFVSFLINKIEIIPHKEKCANCKIPEIIKRSSWKIKSKFIRGLTDTDGSYFLAKKGNNQNYPCIEISTISKPLSQDLKEILTPKFDPKIRISPQKCYRIAMYGEEKCKKWVGEIGSSHPRKINKFAKSLKSN
jgi:hypothetical protein